MPVNAKVITHSRVSGAPDLITMQVRFPWWLLPEMNTHRVFSRNYGSTRAIPIKKLLAEAMHDPALPEVWTGHQPGMQGTYDLTHTQVTCAEEQFFFARDAAVSAVTAMQKIGIAKQNANRLLMPFIHVEGVVTATDWDNFFDLRCHPDADPTMRALAEAMRDAIAGSDPGDQVLPTDGWHLPYIGENDILALEPDWETLAMISAARCARVSYLNHDGSHPDIEKNLALAKRLLESKHMSPFEHQAQAAQQISPGTWFYEHLQGNFVGWNQRRKMIEVR